MNRKLFSNKILIGAVKVRHFTIFQYQKQPLTSPLNEATH